MVGSISFIDPITRDRDLLLGRQSSPLDPSIAHCHKSTNSNQLFDYLSVGRGGGEGGFYWE